MRKLVPLLALALAGCNDTSGPGFPDLSGTWSYSNQMTGPQLGLTCNATGSANLTHTRAGLGGLIMQQGTCTSPTGSVTDISGTLLLTSGQVSGTDVLFDVPLCSFVGFAEGESRMSGTNTCTGEFQGQRVTLSGTWAATR